MDTILVHTEDMKIIKHRDVDRTEALEDIIHLFREGKRSIFPHLRKRFLKSSGPEQLPLFPAMEQLKEDQIQEALH